MPTLSTASDLLDAVQNELRIPTSNTTERAKIRTVMNLVYKDICAKQDWWWLVTSYPLITSLPTGTPDPTLTISLTAESAAFVLSSTPNQSMIHRTLIFDDGAQDARSAYHVGSTYAFNDTFGNLDGLYAGPTGSAVTFRGYVDRFFDIPNNVAKALRVRAVGDSRELERLGFEEMTLLKQRDQSTGRPRAWSIYDFNTPGDPSTQRILWLYPYPDRAYRVELWYKQASDMASTDPLIPYEFVQTLIYGTLARAYPIFLNDLERGMFYQSLFNDVMALMSAQQKEYATDYPGVTTDMRLYRRGTNRPRMTYTLGRYFDTLPNQP